MQNNYEFNKCSHLISHLNTKGRANLEDLGVDGKIKLKWILGG